MKPPKRQAQLQAVGSAILASGRRTVARRDGCLLALDPSSTMTGYCVLSLATGRVLDAGVLRPRTKDTANERIRTMAADVLALMDEYGPAYAVIEDTGARMHAKRGGGGAGMMVYGKAVGWIVSAVESRLAPECITLVEAAKWTGGTAKETRARVLDYELRAEGTLFETGRDKGNDAADAAQLARWWHREHKVRSLK